MGAEIKNLDIYLENPFEGNQMAGSQTFGVILSWISKRLHLGWNVETVLPFQKVGGISLGNVYKVFYAYIYDFGYVGAAILTMVFAVLVQLIYEYATLERKRKINFRIILNSYVLSLVVFSFFWRTLLCSCFEYFFYQVYSALEVYDLVRNKTKSQETLARSSSASAKILHTREISARMYVRGTWRGL
jgi:oligosaccharide repeat unit polymerase